jgi:hypothetical protein
MDICSQNCQKIKLKDVYGTKRYRYRLGKELGGCLLGESMLWLDCLCVCFQQQPVSATASSLRSLIRKVTGGGLTHWLMGKRREERRHHIWWTRPAWCINVQNEYGMSIVRSMVTGNFAKRSSRVPLR